MARVDSEYFQDLSLFGVLPTPLLLIEWHDHIPVLVWLQVLLIPFKKKTECPAQTNCRCANFAFLSTSRSFTSIRCTIPPSGPFSPCSLSRRIFSSTKAVSMNSGYCFGKSAGATLMSMFCNEQIHLCTFIQYLPSRVPHKCSQFSQNMF